MTQRVAILISGGGSNMVALAKGMTNARPVLVLSNNAMAGGLAKARALGIETSVVDHRPFKDDRAAFEAALQQEMEKARPDILCLAGFMRILTGDFIKNWQGRILNIHPSLLPKFRGLDTHARALAAGEIEHGCTVHEVTDALDDGPILGQARVPILPGDTHDDLAARVLKLEHLLYPQVLSRFAAGNRDPLFLSFPGEAK